jgi:hypothetical protein
MRVLCETEGTSKEEKAEEHGEIMTASAHFLALRTDRRAFLRNCARTPDSVLLDKARWLFKTYESRTKLLVRRHHEHFCAECAGLFWLNELNRWTNLPVYFSPQ